MPTLLQINVALNYGSTGRIVELIGRQAKSDGWTSVVAHGPRYVRPSQLKSIQINSSLDEKVHGLLYSLLCDRHGMGSKQATKRLIKEIQHLHPDIIHLHNIHGYYINYPILFDYLNSVDIPIVWTFHDCWPMTGHCTYFESVKCNKWKSLCFSCPLKHEYPRSLFIDNSQHNYKLKEKLFSSLSSHLTVVTVSHWLESIVRESFFYKSNIKTIYNGLDVDTFSAKQTSDFRRNYSLENKFIAVACASPWSKNKGWDDYINLARLLDDSFIIVMVGLSQKQIEMLPSNVIGLKRIDEVSKLVDIYSTADVVLNLSYQETLGMTTLEGMSCGTPSIVYNCTASPELIDNKTGYVVEKSDLNSVKACMIEIRKRGKSYYSKACRDRIEKKFNAAKQYEKYIELYNILLEQKKNK